MRTYEELVKEAIKKAHEEETTKVEEIKAFEVGKTYSTRSICDSNCIFSVEIIKRTAKTVVVRKNGKEQRCKITLHEGKETIYPWGVYSMCPVIKGSITK